MINIAVFVSGRGSNLRALTEFFVNKQNAPKIKLVVSDKTICPALEFAQNRNLDTISVGNSDDKVSWEKLLSILFEKKIDLIVLAGFLKKIPLFIVEKFENKIINIHPALLPAFGGKGMYGMNVHKAVFYSSAKVSGATVHFVNENYDEGKIIAQRCVDISSAKSPEEIAKAVLEVEHQLLPEVVMKFAEDKIKILGNGRVEIL